MFSFSSWKDRVVPSSVGGGWGRVGAGDQVLDKLSRCVGGDASEPMCVPLEGSWPSCACPGWVPRTEQRALLCEPLLPHPLPGPAAPISPLSGAQRPPPASTWRCSREAGILQAQSGRAACFGAHGWSALFTDINLGRAHCWALHVPYPLSGLPSSPAVLASPGRPLGWVRPLVMHPSPPRLTGWLFLPLIHRVQIRSFALLEF